MLSCLLDVLTNIGGLVASIGRTSLVAIVLAGIEDVLANALSLVGSLVCVGLVDFMLGCLLDVLSDRGGRVGQLVDGVLGVSCIVSARSGT
jgi:hypothetical protein